MEFFELFFFYRENKRVFSLIKFVLELRECYCVYIILFISFFLKDKVFKVKLFFF